MVVWLPKLLISNPSLSILVASGLSKIEKALSNSLVAVWDFLSEIAIGAASAWSTSGSAFRISSYFDMY